MNKLDLSRAFNKFKLNVKQHSPEILIGAGIVGVVASGIMACKATTKLNEITSKHKKDVEAIHKVMDNPEIIPEGTAYTKEDGQKDLTITYTQTGFKIVKLYAPSVILGALSIACLVSSNNIMKKRNAALVAAYTTVDSSFKKYRKAVVDRFGEELDKELRFNIKAKEVEVVEEKDGEEVVVKKTVNVTGMNPNEPSDYARFFDAGNAGWQKDSAHNLWYLKQQQNFANQKLKAQGYLFLNDVYDMLGIPRSQPGQIVGWIYDDKNPDHEGDNYVDFGIYDITRETCRDFVNGYECSILLDFNVDGPIIGKLA